MIILNNNRSIVSYLIDIRIVDIGNNKNIEQITLKQIASLEYYFILKSYAYTRWYNVIYHYNITYIDCKVVQP